MPAPRRPARGRRKVKKNIPIGQAHIKTSFNNTIVSLTDQQGNVIAWESAGGAGFKGSRKSTPFAAQGTADAAARQGSETGLRTRDADSLAAGRGPRCHRCQGRHPAGTQRLSPAQAASRLSVRGTMAR